MAKKKAAASSEDNFLELDFSNTLVDPNYNFSVRAGGDYLLGVSPVDENRFILPLVRHYGFIIPQAADGEAVTWREESLYMSRYGRWLRVFRFTNQSSVDVNLSVTLKLL